MIVLAATVLAVTLAAAAGAEDEAGERPLVLRGAPLLLDNGNRALSEIGGLRYRAGYHVTADREEFGGFSGMELSPDGRWMVAVSDRGYWLLAELFYAPDHTLEGFGHAEIGPLLDLDGKPVESRERRDAEEVLAYGERFLVAFEGDHRIFSYAAEGVPPAPRGLPAEVASPGSLGEIHHNTGMEAVAALKDGRLLILTEDYRTADGSLIGWTGTLDGDWERLTLRPTDTFLPTSAAVLPDGDILLLERTYDEESGITRIRISRIAAGDVAGGAELVSRELAQIQPPQTVDNMEAIAVRSGPSGEVLIFIISDDNYNDKQRTLLMQFEMLAESP